MEFSTTGRARRARGNMVMRLPYGALLFAIAMAIASPAHSEERAPTPAECSALTDARDQLAPGMNLRAIQPMLGGNDMHRGTRLRAVAEVIPSDILPQLEYAMARASGTEFEMHCPEDRERGGVSGWRRRGGPAPTRRLRMSLPAFSSDGRWMTLALLRGEGYGSEGYECAFERSGGRWVRRHCGLTFIS